MSDHVPSPCIRECTLGDDEICIGCYRAMDEIVAWASLSNQQRQAVLAEADNRRKQRSIKGV